MLKLVIALVTLFVLTLIIRIAVVTVIHIFTPQEQQGGAVNIMIGAASNLSNKVMEAVTSNMKYVLGFMTPSAFIIVYLVIIPIFVLLFMMVFVRTYDQNIIKNENKDNAPRIMETQHHYLMMFLASLVFMSFVFLIIDWMSRSFKSVDK